MPESVYRLARCRGCKCLYVDSNVTDEYLSGLYADETTSSVSEIGYDHSDMVALRVPEFTHTWEIMSEFRAPVSGDRLLDFGCQTGEFGLIAARSGVVPDGIELSTEYRDSSARAWGDQSQVFATPSDEGLLREQYQYVTAFETLEHIVSSTEALARLGTWLAPDGILAFSVPSAQYFRTKIVAMKLAVRSRSDRTAKLRNPVPHLHVYTFSRDACLISLRRAGLELLFMGVTGWHGPLRRMNPVTETLARATRQRVLFAPSIFVIAKRSDQALKSVIAH